MKLKLSKEQRKTRPPSTKVDVKLHKVTLEPYVRAFQYKVLKSILNTNSKLYKIGYSQHDLCAFCKSYPEKLNHFLYSCHGFGSPVLKRQLILLGKTLYLVLSRSFPLLNYFLLIAKIYLWDCRRNQILPNFNGFKAKILIKCDTENYIGLINKKGEMGEL